MAADVVAGLRVPPEGIGPRGFVGHGTAIISTEAQKNHFSRQAEAGRLIDRARNAQHPPGAHPASETKRIVLRGQFSTEDEQRLAVDFPEIASRSQTSEE